jgi:hypothetical protein
MWFNPIARKFTPCLPLSQLYSRPRPILFFHVGRWGQAGDASAPLSNGQIANPCKPGKSSNLTFQKSHPGQGALQCESVVWETDQSWNYDSSHFY